jgi:uncharacterized protein
MRALATIHSVRIVVVAFSVPFFLHLVLGRELRGTSLAAHAAPDATLVDWLILFADGLAGFVIARLLLLSAGVHGAGLTQVLPPGWLVAAVQVVIGAVAGGRFAGIRWMELRNTVAQALVWSAALLLMAIATAGFGTLLFCRPFAALVLAVAPGGMTEMTIMSYALGIETAFVVTSHLPTLPHLLHADLRAAPVSPARQSVGELDHPAAG